MSLMEHWTYFQERGLLEEEQLILVKINQVKRNTRNNNENNRNTTKKSAETNPRTLTNQKSTPALRGNNPIKPNKNVKDDKKGLYPQ